MLGDRRLFDDMARVASGAAGAFGGLRSRMEGELRDQAERLLSRMNLVTREDFEVVAALARTARAEQEGLMERIAALEATLAGDKPTGRGKDVKAALNATGEAGAKPAKAAKPKTARTRRRSGAA